MKQKQRTHKECLYCRVNNKDGNITGKYKQVAIEVPYINIYFHVKCYNLIENMSKFLQDTVDIWYNQIK